MSKPPVRNPSSEPGSHGDAGSGRRAGTETGGLSAERSRFDRRLASFGLGEIPDPLLAEPAGTPAPEGESDHGEL
jgi:hypothetical protein